MHVMEMPEYSVDYDCEDRNCERDEILGPSSRIHRFQEFKHSLKTEFIVESYEISTFFISLTNDGPSSTHEVLNPELVLYSGK